VVSRVVQLFNANVERSWLRWVKSDTRHKDQRFKTYCNTNTWWIIPGLWWLMVDGLMFWHPGCLILLVNKVHEWTRLVSRSFVSKRKMYWSVHFPYYKNLFMYWNLLIGKTQRNPKNIKFKMVTSPPPRRAAPPFTTSTREEVFLGRGKRDHYFRSPWNMAWVGVHCLVIFARDRERRSRS
jgi:hypothetical protein